MIVEKFNRNLKGNFFIQRVEGVRNELSEEVVEAQTIITFKRPLDRYKTRKGLEGYGPSADKWDWFRWGNLVGMD